MNKITMVRDLPVKERPREKLLFCGAAALSNAELLAILLHTGTKEESVLDLAERILAENRSAGIAALANLSVASLQKIRGIGKAKAVTLVAAVEIGRRLAEKKAQTKDVIHGPEDVADYVMPHLRYEQKEIFMVLLLDMKNQVISLHTVSVGNLNASLVHPREVFRAALANAAAGIILIHNHPSGDPSPSSEDIDVTRRLQQAGEIMGILILDHIIIGDNKYVSLKEKGMVK